MTTVLPKQACLVCGHGMNRRHVTGFRLGVFLVGLGKLGICIRCGYIMVYDDALRFRHPTTAERAEILHDERITAAIHAINRMNAMRNS